MMKLNCKERFDMSISNYKNSNKRFVLKKHIRNNKAQVKKQKNMHEL